MRHRNELTGKLATWRVLLGTGVLAGGLALFGATPNAKADDECQERIVKADHRLHEAAEKHGWESRQAHHAREELREARRYCWEHGHRWWDEDERRWHSDHDWDDHDHDHAREHH